MVGLTCTSAARAGIAGSSSKTANRALTKCTILFRLIRIICILSHFGWIDTAVSPVVQSLKLNVLQAGLAKYGRSALGLPPVETAYLSYYNTKSALL